MKKIMIVLFIVIILALVLFFILRGYSVSWCGFSGYTNSNKEDIPPKRLWDWLNLLIVPLILAIVAYILNDSRKSSEIALELNRQRNEILDDYLTFMTNMLLEEKLSGDKSAIARHIARTRTLHSLSLLDGERKAMLIQFLYESGLIYINPVLSLTGADCDDAKLDNAVLRGVELRGVYFRNASFKNANLEGADLRGSDFRNAIFSDACVEKCNFIQANLSKAQFNKASLNTAVVNESG